MLAVDINDDPFAENPLAFSIYKVGYRKNARHPT